MGRDRKEKLVDGDQGTIDGYEKQVKYGWNEEKKWRR